MSLLGTLILVVISSGLTYFVARSGSSTSGPVPLSPEVRRYLDERLGGTAAGAGQDPQKLLARVAQMEAKLVDMEKVRAQYEEVAAKSELVEAAISEQRRKREDLLVAARASELSQLRNEIATICAGVTIKRVRATSPGPGEDRAGGTMGAPGSAPPQPYKPPDWTKPKR